MAHAKWTIVQEMLLTPPDAHEAAPCLWRRRTNAPDCARQIARRPITLTCLEPTQTATPTQRPDPINKEHRQATVGPRGGNKEHRQATFGPHSGKQKKHRQQCSGKKKTRNNFGTAPPLSRIPLSVPPKSGPKVDSAKIAKSSKHNFGVAFRKTQKNKVAKKSLFEKQAKQTSRKLAFRENKYQPKEKQLSKKKSSHFGPTLTF